MDNWGVTFLGLLAVAGMVQAGFLVAMALAVIRLAQRIDTLQDKLDHQIAPTLKGLERVSRNAAEISDMATLQARRIDLLLADTIEKVDDTLTVIHRLVARPLRPVSHVAALLRGIQRGVDVFVQLERKERVRAPEGRRHAEDDEHLFI